MKGPGERATLESEPGGGAGGLVPTVADAGWRPRGAGPAAAWGATRETSTPATVLFPSKEGTDLKFAFPWQRQVSTGGEAPPEFATRIWQIWDP